MYFSSFNVGMMTDTSVAATVNMHLSLNMTGIGRGRISVVTQSPLIMSWLERFWNRSIWLRTRATASTRAIGSRV